MLLFWFVLFSVGTSKKNKDRKTKKQSKKLNTLRSKTSNTERNLVFTW